MIIDKKVMLKFEQYLLKESQDKIDVNKMSEDEILDLLAQDQGGNIVKRFKNPNKRVQLIIANSSPYSYKIKLIKNPHEEAQLILVKEFGYDIKFFKNPSKKVQLAAVANHGEAIQYINNPDEDVQFMAITNSWTHRGKPRDHRYRNRLASKVTFNKYVTMKNDSNFQIKVITVEAGLIKFFDKISLQAQELALQKDPTLLKKYPKKFSSSIKRKYSHLKLSSEMGILDHNLIQL